jgi:hypothetical protein
VGIQTYAHHDLPGKVVANGDELASIKLSIGGFGVQICKQLLDSQGDVVAERADGLQVKVCRVGQIPGEVALARVAGPGVAAAHGDHHIGGPCLVRGQRLGDSREMSSPISAIAWTTAGLSWLAAWDPAEVTRTRRLPGGR